jgi:hypothetical protein
MYGVAGERLPLGALKTPVGPPAIVAYFPAAFATFCDHWMSWL